MQLSSCALEAVQREATSESALAAQERARLIARLDEAIAANEKPLPGSGIAHSMKQMQERYPASRMP